MQAFFIVRILCLHNYQSDAINASIFLKWGASMEEEITGKAKGGKARAEKLSKQERTAIASAAASARWAKEAEGEGHPKATHRGELHIGELKIPCAVLSDERRVISEHGITTALGSRSGASKRKKKSTSEGGAPLPIFLAPSQLEPFISEELRSGPLAPIVYKEGRRTVIGYSAEILPAICDVWLRARESDSLQKQQLSRAQNAEILMRGLAKVGIIALVDEATGFQSERNRDDLQKFLALYLSEEKLKWAKMFPDEYYRQLFRLWGWNYDPVSVKRPKYVGILTNRLVYEKLPANVIEELKRLNPVKNKKTWRRGAANFQYLSADIGQPDLRDHLLQLIAIMRISKNKDDFKRHFAVAFPTPGDQMDLFEEE